jgi:acyl-CoA synthetase (AMP-forming)/AMP-acid ligase II
MPLFHIHGLIAGVLAPLAAGSLVFCTPGFNALKFFAWMKECKPTWYTAVPTMHQTILARAGGQPRDHRGASAALHPLVVVVDAAAGDCRARAVFNAP